MGFNLGLAAAAYQGVKAEQRRIRDDDFTKAQQDYALAKLEEYASRRGDRDNAAALEDEQVTARRGLLPQQTAVEGLRLASEEKEIPLQSQARTGGLQATIADQKFSESQRGTREETARVQGATGLVNAQNAKDDADDVRAWGPVRRLENSLKIEAAIASQPQKREEFQDDVIAGIYEAGDAKGMEEKAIIHRINGVTGSRLFPELYGKTVGDIKLNNGNAELYDDKGTLLMSIPQQRMKAAYEKRNPGKVITMADGVNAYRQTPGGGLTKLTDNVKSFNPNTGLGGGRGGGSSQLDRFAADLMDEAKAAGKPINAAEAKRRAVKELKNNPAGWAQRALNSNLLYTTESDPEKRAAMEDQALGSAVRMAKDVTSGKTSPAGLGSLPQATAARIDALFPQKQ